MKKILNFFKNNKFKIIITFILLVLCSGGYYWYYKRTTTKTTYVYANVTKGTLQKTVSVSGNILALNQQNGNFSVSSNSIIKNIYIKVGDNVKKGQALASIDNTDLNDKLLQAQVSLNQANNSYKALLLTGGRNVTYLDYNNARDKIKTAQSNYDIAKANYDKSVLKANFDGQIASIDMIIRNTAGTTSIIVVDPKSLYIEVSLTESQVTKIKKSMTANITFEALSNKSYIGKVSDISYSGTISSNVVSYKAKINIIANDGNLRLGFTGKSSIILESKADALYIPTSAVKSKTDGTYYVQVKKNDKIEDKTITYGMIGDSKVEITSGLKENEQIVLSKITTTSTSSSNNSSSSQTQRTTTR